jgi:FMN phosphatase YigB (HAD superfamily)
MRIGLQAIGASVTTSVEHGTRKPCPTIYQRALSVSGCTPEHALFVGDSFGHDYIGPRAAGLQALLIDASALEDVPDEHRLHSILDLRERIGA